MEEKASVDYSKRIQFVMVIEIITNIFLSILKVTGGLLIGSQVLISDGIDSTSDILTSSVALITGKKANKKADDDHQFGHSKIENLVSLFFGIIILITSFTLLYNAIISIINKNYIDNSSTKLIGLTVAFCALILKLIIALFTYINARKTNSPLLKTQSIDYLMDSFSTLISLIVLSLIYFFPLENWSLILDPIGSIIIALVIFFGALRIIIENSSSLLDKACKKEELELLTNIILVDKNILHIDALRTRIVANRVFIEVEITVDENLSLKAAHDIAENLKQRVLTEDRNVKHCLVHVNPFIHEECNDL